MNLFLKTGDFADKIGVSPSTLRNYEDEGLIIPHHKSPKGQRFYTQEQVEAFLAGDFNNPVLCGKCQ